MTVVLDDFDFRIAQLEAELRGSLATAFEAALGSIDLDALAAAIESRDEKAIAIALGIDEALQSTLDHRLNQTLFYGVLGGVVLAMVAFSKRHGSRVDTTHIHERIRDDIRRKIIEPISRSAAESAIETIKGLVAAGFDPRTVAFAAREAMTLAPDQARSVLHFRRALFEALNAKGATTTKAGIVLTPAAIKAIQIRHREYLNAAQRSVLNATLRDPITAAIVDKLNSRHPKALADYRLRIIAQQEATRAVHLGEYLGFRDGKANRSLPRTARRFWKTMGDERVRHDHSAVAGMNPKGVDVGEPFRTPLGPVLYPPLEINCRCRVVVRTPGEGEEG